MLLGVGAVHGADAAGNGGAMNPGQVNETLMLLCGGALIWCAVIGLVLLVSMFSGPATEPSPYTGERRSQAVKCEPVDLEDGQRHWINGDWDL